jgi:hypothetical protein
MLDCEVEKVEEILWKLKEQGKIIESRPNEYWFNG